MLHSLIAVLASPLRGSKFLPDFSQASCESAKAYRGSRKPFASLPAYFGMSASPLCFLVMLFGKPASPLRGCQLSP